MEGETAVQKSGSFHCEKLNGNSKNSVASKLHRTHYNHLNILPHLPQRVRNFSRNSSLAIAVCKCVSWFSFFLLSSPPFPTATNFIKVL